MPHEMNAEWNQEKRLFEFKYKQNKEYHTCECNIDDDDDDAQTLYNTFIIKSNQMNTSSSQLNWPKVLLLTSSSWSKDDLVCITI